MEMLKQPLTHSLEQNRAKLKQLEDAEFEVAKKTEMADTLKPEGQANRHLRRKQAALERHLR